MSYDDWPDNTAEDRREMIRRTIRPAPLSELRELGEKYFPVVTDPWFDRYQMFLKENESAKFYRAEAPGGAEVIYCRESGQGCWFLPGSGMGIIQPKGLQVIAEIVDHL
jgi:hypothetical protein